jgi:hypothetical protein
MAQPANIRVLQLADSPYMGGITSHIATVLEAFRGHDSVDCLGATLPGRREDRMLIDRCEAANLPMHVFDMHHRLDGSVRKRIREYVRENGIDLIHTHNYRANLVCLGVGVPVVNTSHGVAVEPGARLRLYQRGELWAMRRHPLVIACSRHVSFWLQRRGIKTRRIRIVYNGVLAPSGAAWEEERAKLEIPQTALVVLYVGRLVEGKGLGAAVEAVAGIPGAVGIFVGDGPLKEGLQSLARQMGADIRFPGAVLDPSALYEVADVVVLPAEMEAMPMCLIEAAAHGRPVVASNVGGIPEIVSNGNTGFLIPPEDAKALRGALRRLTDRSVRMAMGRRAQALWTERFTPQRMAEGLATVYREALGRPAAVAAE